MFASRKPTRIPNYDYSQNNYYFITICTHEKACIFGTVEKLNQFGEIARQDLQKLENCYEGVKVDNYIVMPNHIHAIIVMNECKCSLSQVIGLYKSGVTKKIRQLDPEMQVWQRSYHDHIIRNQAVYEKIWNYVQFNREKWKEDCFFPGNC